MDVDGTANNFDRLMLRAIPQPKDAPRRGIWGIIPQRVTTEKQAQTKMRADAPALLVFSGTTEKNALGPARSFQLCRRKQEVLAHRRAFWSAPVFL